MSDTFSYGHGEREIADMNVHLNRGNQGYSRQPINRGDLIDVCLAGSVHHFFEVVDIAPRRGKFWPFDAIFLKCR